MTKYGQYNTIRIPSLSERSAYKFLRFFAKATDFDASDDSENDRRKGSVQSV